MEYSRLVYIQGEVLLPIPAFEVQVNFEDREHPYYCPFKDELDFYKQHNEFDIHSYLFID